MESVFQILLRQQQMIQSLEQQLANVDRFAAATGDMAEAIVSLMENGKAVTKSSVLDTVSRLEIDRMKIQVQKQIDEKKIVAIESVESPESLLSIESDSEFGFVFNTAARLEEVLGESLIGKKVGDAVKSFKITAIYKVNQPQPEPSVAEVKESAPEQQ
jgi:hypothetical protein